MDQNDHFFIIQLGWNSTRRTNFLYFNFAKVGELFCNLKSNWNVLLYIYFSRTIFENIISNT